MSMKRVVIGLVIVLVLGGIVFASLRANKGKKGPKVYVEEAKRREIVQVVKATGSIDPKEKVNLSSHVVGKIEKLYVREGDSIRAGQPFLDLEKDVYLSARDRWAAQLASAGTSTHKAEVTLADSRLRLARAVRLAGEGVVSQEQLEAAQLAESSARLSLDEAREGVTEARANLSQAKTDLAKTTIYAPISGRVIRLDAEQGEVVVFGTMNNPASIIGVIADLSEILGKVDVDETEVVNVHPGQSATLKVDAVSAREYHGHVVEVGSSGSSRPQQPDVTFFEVKIQLDDADEALRPGMSVRASIRAETHANALVVPIQSVVERAPLGPDGKPIEGPAGNDEVKVAFVVEGGKAKQKPVTLGLSDETHIEILSGLSPGAKVITGPYRTLRDLKDGEIVQVSTTSEAEDRRTAREKDRDKKEKDEE
ncbi:MAG TPA: efflux RND transporter periplasmic adaptor subunit [Thermoanaerobaculia bacterium]|jgi:HlyD family secretion protein|nr:efflux RND transporter periplasmic adaptor subunit [Thermoanaerobaculia bacterium]